MLDFSSAQNQTHTIYPWLNLLPPGVKSHWPVLDSETKNPLAPDEYQKVINKTTRYTQWRWPDQKIHFISDVHADADALINSLLLSNSIKKTGLDTNDFVISEKAKNHRIIIGGDCLDKGPGNLALLRTPHKLIQLKKNTILLAGNHDIRLYMGLRDLLKPQNTASEHFFIRMGVKVLPLFKEVYNQYIAGTHEAAQLPSRDACQKILYPSKQWQDEFQRINENVLDAKAMQRELSKIAKKQKHFESDCLDYGLTLPMVYLAAKKCYSLFMEPDGEFFWFFNSMTLIHREKSFLFTHAGIDNKITRLLEQSSIKQINQQYKEQLTGDLCQFYYGTIANLLRTKYRKTDPKLGKKGVKRMHRLGIHAIVHGHVSQLQGQNISSRSGMLNFECDVTLDRNSRLKANLSGHGAGVTTISPKGNVKGISTDAATIKVFKPYNKFETSQ